MENTVLKLLQCLSDINSNNCLVSVYANGQTGIQSNKYTKYHSLQGRLCRNIQGGFSIQNIDFDILKKLIVLKNI